MEERDEWTGQIERLAGWGALSSYLCIWEKRKGDGKGWEGEGKRRESATVSED